jgi:hypothetical protein
LRLGSAKGGESYESARNAQCETGEDKRIQKTGKKEDFRAAERRPREFSYLPAFLINL